MQVTRSGVRIALALPAAAWSLSTLPQSPAVPAALLRGIPDPPPQAPTETEAPLSHPGSTSSRVLGAHRCLIMNCCLLREKRLWKQASGRLVHWGVAPPPLLLPPLLTVPRPRLPRVCVRASRARLAGSVKGAASCCFRTVCSPSLLLALLPCLVFSRRGHLSCKSLILLIICSL